MPPLWHVSQWPAGQDPRNTDTLHIFAPSMVLLLLLMLMRRMRMRISMRMMEMLVERMMMAVGGRDAVDDNDGSKARRYPC